MISRALEELEVGDAAELARVVTQSDVADFVGAIGDRNPIHSDPVYAGTTPFGAPIAPGVWTAGLVAAAMGTRLPGPGTIYLSQTLRFLKPVRFGDVITAHVKVTEVNREKGRVRMATTCVNQHGEDVLVGEAWVRPSEKATSSAERPPAVVPLVSGALAPLLQSARVLSFWCELGSSFVEAAMPCFAAAGDLTAQPKRARHGHPPLVRIV